MRKAYCLLVLMVATGLVMAQKDKEKDKGKDKDKEGTKAVLVKADPDKKMLVVDIGGKKREFTVDKDTKIVGPRGGKSMGLKDDRLTPGAELVLVLSPDGKALKEVRLPFRKGGDKDKDKKDKDKDKDKDKGKDKEKDKKDKA